MKARVTLSLDESTVEFLNRGAKSRTGGNVSAYVDRLVRDTARAVVRRSSRLRGAGRARTRFGVTPRRGEVWRYDPVVFRRGGSVLRLIVSAEPINRDSGLRVVLAVNVVDSDPGGLLAVADDELGWVSELTV